MNNELVIQKLGPADVAAMHNMLDLFGEVFGEQAVYCDRRPDDRYLTDLLARDEFIALVAVESDRVVGGLAAYELRKFEQARSEIYIYDLAVAANRRRRGCATALIEAVKSLARERAAYTVYVQADTGAEDAAAIALYSRLGTSERVLHFDIDPSE